MVLIILFIIVVVGFLFAKVQYLGAKQSLFLIIFLFWVYFNANIAEALLIHVIILVQKKTAHTIKV